MPNDAYFQAINNMKTVDMNNNSNITNNNTTNNSSNKSNQQVQHSTLSQYQQQQQQNLVNAYSLLNNPYLNSAILNNGNKK